MDVGWMSIAQLGRQFGMTAASVRKVMRDIGWIDLDGDPHDVVLEKGMVVKGDGRTRTGRPGWVWRLKDVEPAFAEHRRNPLDHFISKRDVQYRVVDCMSVIAATVARNRLVLGGEEGVLLKPFNAHGAHDLGHWLRMDRAATRDEAFGLLATVERIIDAVLAHEDCHTGEDLVGVRQTLDAARVWLDASLRRGPSSPKAYMKTSRASVGVGALMR